MADPQPLAGRAAIVTGASHGIGLAIAERLLEDGAAVLVNDLDADAIGRAATELAGKGRVESFAGDLSKNEVAEALVARAVGTFGKLDILVNNAGGGVIRPFLEHTPETLVETVNRNLWTAIWCCRAAIPAMLAHGYGRIVNIGADSVRTGLPEHAGYNAAKGGMHGMTTGLAREFGRQGITVNTVAPSATSTKALEHFRLNFPERYDRFVDVIPLGRPAHLSEVVGTVAFLAGPDAGFITGQVISVNGGSAMP